MVQKKNAKGELTSAGNTISMVRDFPRSQKPDSGTRESSIYVQNSAR